jgi:drug/metabolite transporter (DMT)-like permease
MGLANTALPFVLISWGQQFIDSGVASILNGTVPLWAMVFGHYFLVDEQMTWRRVGGILTGFLGVILLVSGELGTRIAANAVLGQAAVILAAVAYGGSSVFARRVLREVSPILQAFTTILVADVLVWAATGVVEAPIVVPELPLTWFAVVWLGLLGSCLAYLLYFYLIQAVGPTQASMVTYLIPVLGVALGVMFLDERITFQLIGGSVLVGLGVWIVNR